VKNIVISVSVTGAELRGQSYLLDYPSILKLIHRINF